MKYLINAFAIAILSLFIFIGCGGENPTQVKYPDIVLILIDSIRPDHMSLYGYHRETTPVLDSLAYIGTTWSRVQGQSSWTLPAMASIMTGLSPRGHSAGYENGNFYGIDPALPTIPLLIARGAGYQSTAFFNVVFLNETFGFHHGFDHFDCHGSWGDTDIRDAEETVNDYLEWYDSSRDTAKPLFSAIHFSDPSLPYNPPSPWNSLFTDPHSDDLFNMSWGSRYDLLDLNGSRVEMDSVQLEIITGLYDSELAFTDNQIGRLISEMNARGTLDNTLFMIVGVHGEELLDHGGFGHGHTLYQEILNVPLIISGWDIPAGTIEPDVVTQTDLLPTILGILDMDTPIWADGIDILAINPDRAARIIPSGNLNWSILDLAAIRLEDMVVIGNPQGVNPVLYNLEIDPGEQNPLNPGRETIDELYYYWSLNPRGNPQLIRYTENRENAPEDSTSVR